MTFPTMPQSQDDVLPEDLSAQGASLAPESQDEGSSTEGNDKPLTRAELLAALDERDRKLTSFTQSQVAKASNRLEQRLREQRQTATNALAMLKASGATEEQLATVKARMDQNLLAQALDEEGSEAQPPDQPPAQPNGKPPAQPSGQLSQVNQAAQGLVTQYGVQLSEADPEWATVITTGSALQYLGSLETALANKQARVTNPQRRAARVPAAAPAGQRGRPNYADMSMDDLMRRAVDDIGAGRS